MKRLLALLINLTIFSAFAQVAPDKYFVEFTDKNGTPYTIDRPDQFLSARSIERRVRHNIATTLQDLPVNPAYVNTVSAIGVTVLNRTKWFNGVTIYTTNPFALAAINSLPFVKQVLKGEAIKKCDKVVENHKFNLERGSAIPLRRDEIYTTSSIGTYNYGRAYNQIHMLKGDSLHELGFRGQGQVIAVLDAGFRNADKLPVFDSLRANNQILGTRDFVSPGNNVYDEYYHGMSVLSTMGGNLPGKIIGTAPKASYWLFRTEEVETENYIEEYNWVSGAEAADSVGADIINSSLGYNNFDDSTWNHSWTDLTGNTAVVTIGANIAASKGIAVVCSAGNDGTKPWRYICVPADGDNVLAIGAVDSIGDYATFSSHGVPGNSVKPNVVSQGKGALVALPDSTFAFSSGTSYSSPIIAGLVACLWQSRPDISVNDIYKAIEMSGNHYNTPDTLMGYGIPDFSMFIAHLGIEEPKTHLSTVYPNPFVQDIFIRNYSKEGDKVEAILYNGLGQIILQQQYILHPGENLNILNTGKNCPPGLYLLNLKSHLFSENYHLIKL
jgi:serine protease AprX